MKREQKGITWWRAMWIAAMIVCVFLSMEVLIVVEFRSTDRTMVTMALTASVFSFLLVTFGLRSALGPRRWIASPPIPLNVETETALRRRSRLWGRIVVVGLLVLYVLVVLEQATVLGTTAWFETATLFYGMGYTLSAVCAMGGFTEVYRARLEGMSLDHSTVGE